MEIVGYIFAIIIGLTLGLTGGGGSILTVPILVYLMGISPVLATAYSLFIVGIAALCGSLSFMKQKLVHYKSAIIFGAPALTAVYATRRYLMPYIPEEIISSSNITLSKDMLIMISFALIMVFASVSMIKTKRKVEENTIIKYNYPMILIEGIVVGIVTGFIGAGGGFLIIPALVVFAKMPMKLGIGTSLLIIAIKSLIGFLGDVAEQNIDWTFLLSFSVITVIGILLGVYFNKKISSNNLKKGFGWFVLMMGIFIIIKEIIIK